MELFKNVAIGEYDISGIELKNGDEISIEVSKPYGHNNGVHHKGIIVFKNAAFSIKTKRAEGTYDITPLCNYASYCTITKL